MCFGEQPAKQPGNGDAVSQQTLAVVGIARNRDGPRHQSKHNRNNDNTKVRHHDTALIENENKNANSLRCFAGNPRWNQKKNKKTRSI